MIEQGHLESLTEAMVVQHAQLAGLAQGTAEEYYILGAQQLDNYGQETFFAKVKVQTGWLLSLHTRVNTKVSGICAGRESGS